MPLVTRFPARAGSPAERVAGFMAHLRANGLRLGVAETALALEALGAVEAGDLDQTRAALKAVCAGSADEHARFDDLFDAYWRNRGRDRQRTARSDMREQTHHRTNTRKPLLEQAQPATRTGAPDTPDGDDNDAAEQTGEGRLIATRTRNLTKIDMRAFLTPEDVAEAQAIAQRLARAIRDRRSRRTRASQRRQRLDMRRVVRSSLATGGEPIRLHHRARPERPAQLTVICDVSGSMQVYAKVFLAFTKGLMGADLKTDAYLFHTRLVRVTEALRDGDTLRAAGRLSLLAEGFGGGTRIGDALQDFARLHARHRLGGRSVVVILSDGYDSGPPERIAGALARIRKRGARIVWLNPLKGWKDYEPVARGMAAALPYLDLFAPANTLDSLAALEPELARL